MRWFWVFVGLLGVGACVVALTGGHNAHEDQPLGGAGLQQENTQVMPTRVEPTMASEATPKPLWESIAEQESQSDQSDLAAEDEGVGDVEVMGDGSLMLSGRYRVTGRGTPDEPYVVTWELLKSAEEGYAPVLGKKDIPGWIEMLGGMYVRIDGFMMNPTLEAEVDEFLLMKNSWDACCLGLPPTPYDSMEVALGAPAVMPELQHARASVVGRLSVEPSLYAGHFLTGLYTLDDARAEFRAGL